MIRILTKNGVDNTNVDGARDHNFNAGRRSGIVQGALNQGNFFASNNNTIALDTCELRLCGHRIVLDKAEYRTFTNKPSVPVRYSFVARVVVDSDDNVSFEFVSQEATTQLVQDNLDITGSGTYELEIGKFTQLTDGNITDVVRTADLITGGADNDSDYIRIGTVTTNKISPELDADVDIENTINPTDNKPQTNFTFNLPTAVGTVVSVNGEEKTAINTDLTPTANSENLITSGGVHDYPAVTFAESERQKSKNLFPFGNVSGTKQAQRFISLPAGTYTLSTIATSSDTDANTCFVGIYDKKDDWIGGGQLTRGSRQSITVSLAQPMFSILFFASNNQSNSEGDTFTFADIQIEEGSVATDYQPYNGAIVHKSEIEPDLIYDIDTKNTIGGTAYTSGIKFGASTNINVAGYRKIKTYSRVYNTYNITEVVLDKTGWTGNSFMVFGEASAIKNVGILIYHEGPNITPAECFNFSDNAGLNNNDNAYVYRLEGYK